MKHVLAFMVAAALVAVAGCENTQLMECQDQNAALQTQVETANATIAENQAQIEKLQTENVETQNTAMQSITTMMQKQDEKDNQMKAKIDKKTSQIKDLTAKIAALEKQIAEHKCPVPPTPEAAE